MKKSMMKKSIVIPLICVIIGVIALVVIVYYYAFSPWKGQKDAIRVSQQKCREYVELACRNPVPSKKKLPTDSGRIASGKDVKEGTFPHMVYLKAATLCAGTLISEKYVMTSAHCVYEYNDTINLKLGTSDLKGDFEGTDIKINDLLDSPTGEVIGVDEIIVHENYNYDDASTWKYDIALLRLDADVQFDWAKRPICLNTDFDSLDTTNFFVTGWGSDEKQNWVTSLKKVEQFGGVQTRKACSSEHYSYHEDMFCARSQIKQKGICPGDRGAPLQIPLKNKDACENTYEQVGITTEPIDECYIPSSETFFVLYTKIAPLNYWIVQQVWPELLSK